MYCGCQGSFSTTFISSEDDGPNTCCCYCCNSNNNKPLVKGKFGLAYIIETPKKRCVTPLGWEVEFEDTPSRISNNCKKMMKWVNCPPIGKCVNNETIVECRPDKCAELLNNSRQCRCHSPEKSTCCCKENSFLEYGCCYRKKKPCCCCIKEKVICCCRQRKPNPCCCGERIHRPRSEKNSSRNKYYNCKHLSRRRYSDDVNGNDSLDYIPRKEKKEDSRRSKSPPKSKERDSHNKIRKKLSEREHKDDFRREDGPKTENNITSHYLNVNNIKSSPISDYNKNNEIGNKILSSEKNTNEKIEFLETVTDGINDSLEKVIDANMDSIETVIKKISFISNKNNESMDSSIQMSSKTDENQTTVVKEEKHKLKTGSLKERLREARHKQEELLHHELIVHH